MSKLTFDQLQLTPKVKRAIDEMGFETATDIQSQVIPLIRTGVDVIGRSQTGTGKTLAFAIPAIETIDTHEERSTLQVLVLCPTRELAMQAATEIRKLTKFKSGVRTVEVYGGAPMQRQILSLKTANLVVGTPGRVMDHMRRRTIKLNNLKMVVLDEADEMLSMGFKEDIETILADAPEERQTVLFSATMPPAIMSLTRQFQTDPQLVEINRAQVTLDSITQGYIDVPMGRKMDALALMLRFYHPFRSMIFCNTKQMVDEITEYLVGHGFDADGIHGDMKQPQRTKVMDGFKRGKTSILVATDVAARGIDVNDIEYVFNYDIPQSHEYYVHRIGRTGRAGKTGCAVTICSGRRQVFVMKDIARATKSSISPLPIPSPQEILSADAEAKAAAMEAILGEELLPVYSEIVAKLTEAGHTPEEIAAAALQLHFGKSLPVVEDLRPNSEPSGARVGGSMQRLVLGVGRSSRVAPNHIVGALTERTDLRGKDVGKIEIFDDQTFVGIPAAMADAVLAQLSGLKICGKPVDATLAEMISDKKRFGGKSQSGGPRRDFRRGDRRDYGRSSDRRDRRRDNKS